MTITDIGLKLKHKYPLALFIAPISYKRTVFEKLVAKFPDENASLVLPLHTPKESQEGLLYLLLKFKII